MAKQQLSADSSRAVLTTFTDAGGATHQVQTALENAPMPSSYADPVALLAFAIANPALCALALYHAMMRELPPAGGLIGAFTTPGDPTLGPPAAAPGPTLYTPDGGETFLTIGIATPGTPNVEYFYDGAPVELDFLAAVAHVISK